MKKSTLKRSKIISLLIAAMMIAASLPFVGISALAEESDGFEYEILDDGTAEITDYYTNFDLEILEIPSMLDGYTVTSIGDSAFSGCDSLTSITIPNGVTSIGHFAFSCESLTSITIPESVTLINNFAFDDCKSLINITVDENNKNYSSQDGVLFNKDKTELIQYPAGNERTSYSVPDCVTSIEDSAFAWCTSLTSVTIPNSVTFLGWGAFWGCGSLKSITIPNSVTSIGYGTFISSGLTSITIPNSVTSINDEAFLDCPLETIYGYENSYAQTYAEEYGKKFVALDNSGEQGIISEGTDDTYVIGSEKGASIHCSYPIDQFSGVLMDGVEVSSDNYTLTEGSTILTFKPAYLNFLSAGKHEVTLNFVSGSVKSILTIENKAPDTSTDSEKPAETEKPTTTENAAPNKPAGTNNTSPNTGSNTAALGAFSATAVIGLALIALKKKCK